MGKMILQAYTCLGVSKDGEIFPEKILDKPVFILKFAQLTFHEQHGPNLIPVTREVIYIVDKSGEIEFRYPHEVLVIPHKEEDKWQIPLVNYPIS